MARKMRVKSLEECRKIGLERLIYFGGRFEKYCGCDIWCSPAAMVVRGGGMGQMYFKQKDSELLWHEDFLERVDDE